MKCIDWLQEDGMMELASTPSAVPSSEHDSAINLSTNKDKVVTLPRHHVVVAPLVNGDIMSNTAAAVTKAHAVENGDTAPPAAPAVQSPTSVHSPKQVSHA